MLTGKCKEDFEEWLEKEKFGIFIDRADKYFKDNLPFVCMIGVYKKFFDEKGLKGKVIDKNSSDPNDTYCLAINWKPVFIDNFVFRTKDEYEAQTELIKQLIIKYNESTTKNSKV